VATLIHKLGGAVKKIVHDHHRGGGVIAKFSEELGREVGLLAIHFDERGRKGVVSTTPIHMVSTG